MDFLPCIKEIVEDVLLQLNSSFQQKNSYAFLKVCYTFTICIKNLERPKNISTLQKQGTSTENKSSKIIKSLLAYYEAVKVDDDIENTEQIDEIEEENANHEDPIEEEGSYTLTP